MPLGRLPVQSKDYTFPLAEQHTASQSQATPVTASPRPKDTRLWAGTSEDYNETAKQMCRRREKKKFLDSDVS